MATRIYAMGPDTILERVVEGAGAATSSRIINLTVDLANNAVTDSSVSGGLRAVSKAEVIRALETYKEYIIKSNWPPV